MYICKDICKDYRKHGFKSYEECIAWCYEKRDWVKT